jgi:serine/threonine protein kinase
MQRIGLFRGIAMQGQMGEVLGHRYRLLDQLGEGGMGVVFRAADRLTGHLVALKRVHLRRPARSPIAEAHTSGPATAAANATDTGIAQTEAVLHAPSREAFAETLAGAQVRATPVSFGHKVSDRDQLAFGLALAREFNTLASLRHPHIISVLDYGFDRDGQPFYAMELLERAQPLLKSGREQPLNVRIALLAQVLQALDYLHRRGVLHRDLKPSNILVTQVRGEHRVKLLDFGLAIDRDYSENLGELAGTLGYIAPEVFQGHAVTEAADLYSVGVVAFELLAGQHPFADLGDHELVAAVRRGHIPALPETLPETLQQLIVQLLHRDPEQRPRSARQALAELSQVPGVALPPESSTVRDSYLQASRFIGRQHELTVLSDAMEAARGGQGGTFLVAGESGVGKSRLLDELRTRALVRGLRVLRGQAEATGGAVRQHFQEILRAIVLDTTLTEEEAMVLKTMLPDLPVLLQREIADPPHLSPQATQLRALRVLLQVMLRSDQPTLMLLEDIQWTPTEDLGILRGLSQQVASRPMLIVASYRDDERPEVPRSVPSANVLKLQRFGASAIAELSTAMLGEAGQSPQIVEFLGQQTEGNPFFMVEVVRALAEETGSLGEIGRGPLPQRIVASGLQTVLNRRLDRVPESARGLLRQAAVLGRRLDRSVLQTFEPQLDAWLQACADAAIIESSEADYQFSHDKLRERILASLDVAQRKELHLRAATALDKVYGRKGDQVPVIAHHYDQAESWPQAAQCLVLAGGQALARGALQPAADLYRRAAELQAKAAVPDLEQATTHRKLARVLHGLGQNEGCVNAITSAMALLGVPIPSSPAGRARTLLREVAIELRHRLWGSTVRKTDEDLARHRELCGLMSSSGDAMFLVKGRPELPLYLTLLALHSAERAGDQGEQVASLAWLALATSYMPIPGLSQFYSRRAQSLRQKGEGARSELRYHALTGLVAIGRGELAALQLHIASMIKLAEEAGDLSIAALAENIHCAASHACDDVTSLELHAQRVEQLGRQTGNPQILGSALGWQAACKQLRGDAAGAVPLMQSALKRIEQAGSGIHKTTLLAASALIALEAGDPQEAQRLCDESLQRLARGVAPAASFMVGYISVLLASLALYERAKGSREERQAQRRALRALRETARFALVFPIGRPWLELGLGRYLSLAGHTFVGRLLLQRSIQAGAQMGLPRVRMHAEAWLSAVQGGGTEP